MSESLDEVRRVIADIARLPLRSIEAEMRLQRGMGIDSVRFTEIVVALEERLDIRIADDDLRDDLTVGQLADLVDRIKGAGSLSFKPIGPATANCYIGAHVESLSRRGFPAAEVDALVIGEGFRFKIIEDERGVFELTFPWVETVRSFAATCETSLVRAQAPREGIGEALASFIEEHGGAVLSVNTAELPYLTDPVSQEGYTHAILVQSVDRDRGRALLVDCFVPRGEMVTAEIELPLDAVVRAFSARIEGNPYDPEGRFEIIRTPPGPMPPPAQLRERLLEQLASAADETNAVLRDYVDRSLRSVTVDSREERITSLKLWAYEVNTDHAVPSRLILKGAVERYCGSDSELAKCAEASVRAWRALGMSLQRAVIHGEDRDGVLPAKTNAVLAAEAAFGQAAVAVAAG